mmetsp:Transcript_11035/g.36268  ORF Transcript_11035/g.36268 Transcript_11035/m.36268 type:complete len:324 (+) Transcript_11035:3-974(+)
MRAIAARALTGRRATTRGPSAPRGWVAPRKKDSGGADPATTSEDESVGLVVSERRDTWDVDEDGDLWQGFEGAPSEYYTLLELGPEATDDQVKAAYRRLQKLCHPDIAGDAGEEVCVLLNDAYAVLTDPKLRRDYNESVYKPLQDGEMAYTAQPLSTYCGSDPRDGTGPDSRAVFVDESTCIGCRQCVHAAPETFFIEEEWGRARAFQQWADNEEDITTAIEACPVSCIYFVKKRNLPVLEYVMRTARRVGVAVMMGNPGARGDDPFDLASTFVRKGKASAAEGGLGRGVGPGNLSRSIRKAWFKLDEETRKKWGAWSPGKDM